MVAQQTVQ